MYKLYDTKYLVKYNTQDGNLNKISITHKKQSANSNKSKRTIRFLCQKIQKLKQIWENINTITKKNKKLVKETKKNKI